MQIITVSFPKKEVISVANTAKHVVSADLTQILLDLDAINGEIIGTTAADKTDKIEATKLAIETAIKAAGVDVPAGAIFADYPDYVADAVAKAKSEALFNFRAANKTIYSGGYNAEIGGAACVIPDTIGGVAVENIGYAAFDKVNNTTQYGIKITSLVLPSGLKTIGAYAFRENAIAGTLTIPASVTAFNINSFMNNLITTLTFATGGALTVIPSTCFITNKITGKQTFPAPIATIGFNSFNGNLITELDLASTVTLIDQYAFRLNSIIKIKIGANVTINASPLLDTMGVYGNGFETLYNGNGKLAGTYEYAAGSWSKTV